MTRKKLVIAVGLLLASVGCTAVHHVDGNPSVIVTPKQPGADAGYIACGGVDVWREGDKYAVRFRYPSKRGYRELHGLDTVTIEDDPVNTLACE
jgi:hypothetical protein